MQAEQKPATPERMTWSDYTAVYAAQTMPSSGAAPRSWWEVIERYGRTDRELVEAAFDAAKELFGERPGEDGTRLFEVRELTRKEGAIAARMDLPHAGKIELIRPLRAAREASANARYESPSKCELEYRQRREERIASAVREAVVVSAEDHALAAEMGISLD
jgi:hypothetical protein